MPLSVDASTPALKAAGVASQAIASNTFSPPAGSLVCVLAACAMSGASSAASITDSLGGHLNWTKLAEQLDGGGGFGSTTLWVADCPSAQVNMTATATFSGPTVNAADGSIAVIVFTGAKPVASQLGGTGSQGASALPSITVSASAAGSMVVAGWWNWTGNTAPTVPADQTTTFNALAFTYSDATTGGYSWVQTHTALTGSPGSVVTNDTAPNNQVHGVAVEILAVPTVYLPTANVNRRMRARAL